MSWSTIRGSSRPEDDGSRSSVRETTSEAEPDCGTAARRGRRAFRSLPPRPPAFELELEDDAEVEALSYARRAMIRDERTRGLEWDEPSMEDPTLAGRELRWFALASQAAWCREKMAELVARANQARGGLPDQP